MNDTTPTSALQVFSQWVVSTEADHAANASIAIESFVDTIGCIAAGVDAELSICVRDYIGSNSGGTSPIFFSGTSTTRELAAFANAAAGHANELDDWDMATEAHMSVVIVPALLALSKHAKANGADLIDAYLVGLEAAMRFGEAINPGHLYRGWHPTATIGALGGAAACARLLRLDSEATSSAISLATTNAGLKCQAGTLAKALHAGFAAQCAVQCALLAEAGVTAAHNALDGTMGVEVLRSTPDALGFAKAAQRLTNGSAISEYGLVRKLYPTCGSMHRPMDGITALLADHKLDLDQVDSLTVIGSRPEFEHLRIHDPRNVAEARFSVEFGAAAALAFGQIQFNHVTDETLSNDDYRKAFHKVRVETYEPAIVAGAANYPPVNLRLVTTDGREYTATVYHARGWPQQPLTAEEINQKFMDCSRSSLDEKKARELLSTIKRLATLDSSEEIVRRCL